MNEPADLTRWNRAGLSRLRYIDGNAVHWLEWLRNDLNKHFPDWEATQTEAETGQTESEKLDELLARYQAKRGDMLWAMVRTFSRSAHILTETLDAYANESYLQTATQWDNVRRMVDMLDYHPASPASASVGLVLKAKEKESGTVKTGLQVKFSPPDGGETVTFETLEDIDIAPELNELRLSGGDAAVGSLGDNAEADSDINKLPIWIANEDMTDLSAGQIVIVADAGKAVVDEIASISNQSGEVQLKGSEWRSYSKAESVMSLLPRGIYVPRIYGDDVITFEESHGLVSNDVIAWINSLEQWVFDRVTEADDWSIHLEYHHGKQRPVSEHIHKMVRVDRVGEHLSTTADFRVSAIVSGDGFTELSNSQYWRDVNGTVKMNESGTETAAVKYKMLKSIYLNIDSVYIVSGDIQAIGKAAYSGSSHVFSGGSGELSSAAWVAVESNSGNKTLVIDTLSELEDSFSITLKNPDGSPYQGEIERLYGSFKYELRPQGYDENETLLSESTSLGSLSLAVEAGERLSELLIPGRSLIIEQKKYGRFEHAVMAEVTKIDANTIDISPALDVDAGFTCGNTVIRANVVAAGHGKTQPGRVLGSGDATKSNQSFLFSNEGVSFVADATMSSGVRASIEISVAGRIWQQVATLNGSGPSDIHYAVRMTEEAYLKISFGDGAHGCRLPSGVNNIRISWRKGTGIVGNLAIGRLEKVVKPHRLISSVRQPVASSGGSDMESIESLREHAPASLLTLERAVSVADFKHLAASHSSVWQANASHAPAGISRYKSVEVVVVPSGGTHLDCDMRQSLQNYLEEHAIPGCRVRLSEFQRIELSLQIRIQVKSAEFERDLIRAEVIAALLQSLSLENQTLDKAIYLSSIYSIVESVNGVENASCMIVPGLKVTNANGDILAEADVFTGADGVIRRVDASMRQLIYLAEDSSGISMTIGEYSL